MRFVIGGADSGKRDFVRENYGIDELLFADDDCVLTANEDNTYTSRYDGGKFKAKIYWNNRRRFDKYRLSERRLS